MAGRDGPNAQLRHYLDKLGWSPGRLACELNHVLGPAYAARSTVAEWLKGRIPREPLPTITAHVIGEAVGESVSLTSLWGPGVRPSSGWVR